MADPEVPDTMRDKKTPASVRIRWEARKPEDDPTVGVPLKLPDAAAPAPAHRLVAIGDSLTHGFQSGAIYNTALSYPAIIAWEMGWSDHFRYPRYGGPGGLPINIEYVVRRLEDRYGAKIDWYELASAAFSVRSIMDDIEDYWETGRGSRPPISTGINHNLGIYGWDVRDVLERTSGICADSIGTPKDNTLDQLVEDANDRAALRVLPPREDERGMTPLDAARKLGDDGGIETLIVMLGANNALGTVVKLKVEWSKDPAYRNLKDKRAFTVWDPDHFAAELKELVKAVETIKARHVIWATVPHVTIAPVARGVARKVREGSRYYPYYTRPWINDEDFDPADDPRITGQEARAIDAAIDQYNDAIVAAVKDMRSRQQDPRDWFVLDVAGVLDRLAARRYILDPLAQPKWWRPYELPASLARLRPKPDSRFFRSDPDGRKAGGLFSLDGVHPTTIAYGVLAQEFINVMQRAGVPFRYGDGKTPRIGPVAVDFDRLVALDTLVSDPPRSLASDLKLIGWLDEKIDFFKRMF